MKWKITRRMNFCIQCVGSQFSGRSTLENTKLTTSKGQRRILQENTNRAEGMTWIPCLTAARLSFMLTESFLFFFLFCNQPFSPLLFSFIFFSFVHQATSAPFSLCFRLLLTNLFNQNPRLKNELSSCLFGEMLFYPSCLSVAGSILMRP